MTSLSKPAGLLVLAALLGGCPDPDKPIPPSALSCTPSGNAVIDCSFTGDGKNYVVVVSFTSTVGQANGEGWVEFSSKINDVSQPGNKRFENLGAGAGNVVARTDELIPARAYATGVKYVIRADGTNQYNVTLSGLSLKLSAP
jgi:hypothetical protein